MPHHPRRLVATVMLAGSTVVVPTSHTLAATTYHYTGNAFAVTPTTEGLQGKRVVASVTFVSDMASFTGILGPSDVAGWAIEVANVPETRFDSATNSGNARW